MSKTFENFKYFCQAIDSFDLCTFICDSNNITVYKNNQAKKLFPIPRIGSILKNTKSTQIGASNENEKNQICIVGAAQYLYPKITFSTIIENREYLIVILHTRIRKQKSCESFYPTLINHIQEYEKIIAHFYNLVENNKNNTTQNICEHFFSNLQKIMACIVSTADIIEEYDAPKISLHTLVNFIQILISIVTNYENKFYIDIDKFAKNIEIRNYKQFISTFIIQNLALIPYIEDIKNMDFDMFSENNDLVYHSFFNIKEEEMEKIKNSAMLYSAAQMTRFFEYEHKLNINTKRAAHFNMSIPQTNLEYRTRNLHSHDKQQTKNEQVLIERIKEQIKNYKSYI